MPGLQSDEPRHAYLKTSTGEVIQLELYWKHAPKTCHNFAKLCENSYYKGTIFHRLGQDFIQGGDPTGTGKGGQSVYGDAFEDEINGDLRFTGAGILAMANRGPNTNGSQFFITLGVTPAYENKHTIFGRVSGGMKALRRLSSVQVDHDERPKNEIRIIDCATHPL